MDLLIDIYGTRIGCTGERIVLKFPRSTMQKEYPIRRLEKIVILRPASITTHAVRLALEHEVDIVYLGAFGKPVGRIFSSEPKGLATLRRAQLETSTSPRALQLARAFVIGKAANQIAFLNHLGVLYRTDVGREVLQATTMLKSASPLPLESRSAREQLFGIEGYIADRYFSGLRRLFPFPGRNPQGRDKFNSTLNYGYGILYNEVERACLYAGLDPYLGLYHSERYSKPSLVLDLVEEFRVPIIDSVIVPLFKHGKMKERNKFIRLPQNEYRLAPEGKCLVVETVLRRLNQQVFWQGKRYTMKQVIGLQIRALAWNFLGKSKQYTPFDYTRLLKK